jgi:hypothetical protein
MMPFRKVGANAFASPSGRIYTRKQVMAYYASGGFKRKPRRRRKKSR